MSSKDHEEHENIYYEKNIITVMKKHNELAIDRGTYVHIENMDVKKIPIVDFRTVR